MQIYRSLISVLPFNICTKEAASAALEMATPGLGHRHPPEPHHTCASGDIPLLLDGLPPFES